ncbi:MAG: isopentenyl-diphosphate Delta-isomerase [Allorhizobium sp.]
MSEGIEIPAIAADGSLYPVDKMRAHVEGLLHLAVSVFIFDRDLLLIQKRASSKYHSAGQWANTCCTHPHWDESVEHCAGRRLHEELGFTVALTRHQTVEYAADVGAGLREHERVTLFSASVDSRALAVRPVKTEVEAVRWVTQLQLRQEILERPEDFTPWFRIYLQRFPGLSFAKAA